MGECVVFCPKCGTKIQDDNSICSSCNFDISETKIENMVFTSSEPSVKEIADVPSSTERATPSFSVVKLAAFSIIAAVVLFMFLSAANKIASGGLAIMDIKSVGGKTLEEAYYFELGTIYAGYATVTRALGIFFASVLIWMGLKN